MSYMPKYILKRIFPSDCIKLKDNGIEITFNNVLAPMKIEDIPDGEEYLSRFSILIDGTAVPMDVMKQAKVILDGKEYASTNIKALEGQVIPAGGKLVIFAPLTEYAGKKLVKGEEHVFHVIIKWKTEGKDEHKNEFGPLTRSIN